jgi:hypothetical protein
MATLYELLSLTVAAILVTTPALAQTSSSPGGTLGGVLGVNPTGGISGTLGGTPAIVVGPDGLYRSAPSTSTPVVPPAGTVSSPTSSTSTPIGGTVSAGTIVGGPATGGSTPPSGTSTTTPGQ